eukprot:Em0099g10a
MLSRLKITCDNKDFGCTNVVALEGLETHLTECSFNPKRLVQCEKGCSLMVPLDEVPQHSCIKKLHDLLKLEQTRTEDLTTKVDRMEIQLSEQALKMDRLEAQLSEQNRELLKADRLEIQLSEHNREILILKEMVRSLRVCLVFPRVNTTDETEKAIQTVRWLSGLKPARIKRWGGMISTPDDVLQSIIKRALQDSGCPAHMILELMNNAHERRWPCGLNTLESRQLNRQQCEQYVTKRVPGKQAVVIMAMENEHMGESMVTYPGMFALGACKSDTGQNRSDQILIIYRILDNYYSSVYMDEDSVFTKRFVECVKKAVDERTEEDGDYICNALKKLSEFSGYDPSRLRAVPSRLSYKEFTEDTVLYHYRSDSLDPLMAVSITKGTRVLIANITCHSGNRGSKMAAMDKASGSVFDDSAILTNKQGKVEEGRNARSKSEGGRVFSFTEEDAARMAARLRRRAGPTTAWGARVRRPPEGTGGTEGTSEERAPRGVGGCETAAKKRTGRDGSVRPPGVRGNTGTETPSDPTCLRAKVSNTNSMDAVLEVFSKQPAVRSDEDVVDALSYDMEGVVVINNGEEVDKWCMVLNGQLKHVWVTASLKTLLIEAKFVTATKDCTANPCKVLDQLLEVSIDESFHKDFLLTYRTFLKSPDPCSGEAGAVLGVRRARNKAAKHFSDFEGCEKMNDFLDWFEEKLLENGKVGEKRALDKLRSQNAKLRNIDMFHCITIYPVMYTFGGMEVPF